MNKRTFFKRFLAAAMAAIVAPFASDGKSEQMELNHRELHNVMRLVGKETKPELTVTLSHPEWVSFVVHKNLVGQYHLSLYSKKTFWVQFFICNSKAQNTEYWWPAMADAGLSGNQIYFIIKQLQQIELTGHTAPVKGFAECENHRNELSKYLMEWGVA